MIYKTNGRYEGLIRVYMSDPDTISWSVVDQVRQRAPGDYQIHYTTETAVQLDNVYPIVSFVRPRMGYPMIYVRGSEITDDKVVVCMETNARLETLAKFIHSFNLAGFHVELCNFQSQLQKYTPEP